MSEVGLKKQREERRTFVTRVLKQQVRELTCRERGLLLSPHCDELSCSRGRWVRDVEGKKREKLDDEP